MVATTLDYHENFLAAVAANVAFDATEAYRLAMKDQCHREVHHFFFYTDKGCREATEDDDSCEFDGSRLARANPAILALSRRTTSTSTFPIGEDTSLSEARDGHWSDADAALLPLEEIWRSSTDGDTSSGSLPKDGY